MELRLVSISLLEAWTSYLIFLLDSIIRTLHINIFFLFLSEFFIRLVPLIIWPNLLDYLHHLLLLLFSFFSLSEMLHFFPLNLTFLFLSSYLTILSVAYRTLITANLGISFWHRRSDVWKLIKFAEIFASICDTDTFYCAGFVYCLFSTWWEVGYTESCDN